MRAVLEPGRRLAVLIALAALAGCGGGDTARSVDCRGRAASPALTTASFGADDRPALVARAGPGGGVHDLVVAFHGRTNDHAQVRGYFDLEAHARRPTVVVYPSALPVAHPPRAWHDPGDHGGALRDFALFDAIVRETTRRYCVDPERVFVVGHSLGASFANALACTRGRTVRAAASVAGGIATARCEGAAAALLVHHPADRLVPIEVGRRARDTLLAHRGLAGAGSTAVDFAGLACRRWGDAGTAPVLWCRHDETSTRDGRYYPHRWPSTAGAAFMRFFDERP
ncbi:MAG: hypothetical protein GVY33_14160 [Alphaproteobacteria bacterium]|jgi:polyhydroxybutyrate depolymerase|nr:hypothetical protein [Alphaproteobacteria bacterium]